MKKGRFSFLKCKPVLVSMILTALLLVNCQKRTQTLTTITTQTIVPSQSIVLSTRTHQPPTSTSTVTSTSTLMPTKTITPSPSPTFIQPVGCLEPPDNYELVEINGMEINARTYFMLQHAQELYGGEIDLTGYHLTQGSYTNSVSASFGTHSGGGTVDISVIQAGTYQVLYDDIPKIIHALRISGFAAWLRNFDQLYAGSPIHIHAVAIGDKDLSPAAQEQLYGEQGYFAGFNGLPESQGYQPTQDEFGGAVICEWMVNYGYIPGS